jgi:hypothetical protein
MSQSAGMGLQIEGQLWITPGENAELAEQVQCLRGLLARALDEWHADVECSRCSCHMVICECIFDDMEAIRREAGLA